MSLGGRLGIGAGIRRNRRHLNKMTSSLKDVISNLINTVQMNINL